MVAIRELRADLAAQVRRAATGQRIVISVGGRALAQLGPVEDGGGGSTIDALVTAGLLVPPRRDAGPAPRPPVPVWSGVRLDRAFREVRG
jgi:prevent-host-death family protein